MIGGLQAWWKRNNQQPAFNGSVLITGGKCLSRSGSFCRTAFFCDISNNACILPILNSCSCGKIDSMEPVHFEKEVEHGLGLL